MAAPSPSAAQTNEPKKEPIAGEPGDPLTSDEAAQLLGQAGTLRPYEMVDGSFVIIDVKKPLPEAVKNEVVQSIGGVSNDVGSSGSRMLEESAATGKTIILVRQLQTSNDAGENITTWASMSDANGFPVGIQGSSADAVIAQIQPWVDAQENPYLEIVIVDN